MLKVWLKGIDEAFVDFLFYYRLESPPTENQQD
jgi:hypothetical protein